LIQLVYGESGEIQSHSVDREGPSIGCKDHDWIGYSIGDRAKLLLTLAQLLLNALSVVDVGQEEIPRGYLTFRIPHRAATRLEPSISTICAPATQLNITDLARFERPSKRFEHTWKVVSMNDIGSGPVLQLLTGFAEKFQDLLVKKLHLAGWAHRVYESGDVVDDRAKIGLALQQLLLGALAIIDVCKKEVPGGDFSLCVSHRETADLEPSIYAVGTPAAVLYFVNETLFDRLDASLHYVGKIIGMNRVRQGPVLQF